MPWTPSVLTSSRVSSGPRMAPSVPPAAIRAVQPPRAIVPEQIGEQAPEHRDDEQVEHGRPDVEHAADGDPLDAGVDDHREHDPDRRERVVRERDVAAAAAAREQRAPRRRHDADGEERRQEQERDLVGVAVEHDRVAHRTEHEVAREDRGERAGADGGDDQLSSTGHASPRYSTSQRRLVCDRVRRARQSMRPRATRSGRVARCVIYDPELAPGDWARVGVVTNAPRCPERTRRAPAWLDRPASRLRHDGQQYLPSEHH